MHRQAITTRFLGPTTYRGARIKAQASAGSLTVSWDHKLNSSGNHAAAAEGLARKMAWCGFWAAGGMPDERGDVFVCVASRFDYPAAELTDLEWAFEVEQQS